MADEPQDTNDLLEKTQLKIIVVPISPLTKADFLVYLGLLKQFSTVSLAELTPPDSKTEELHHDGCIHFDFTTSYNKELAPLEEIELSRQVLGYPTSLAHRCFGFEPKEDQQDDTKGLILIPHVGDMSFYIQTMINDFTADILLAMGLMAGQLERKSSIVGPVLVSPLFSTGDGPLSGDGASGPVQILVPAQGNGISTPASTKISDVPDTPSTPQGVATSLQNMEKVKKRTPSRAQKLLGDLYLMAGRRDLAINCFVTAMEGAKLNNDYQWQAAALEGYVCAQLVSLVAESIPDGEESSIQGLLSSREIIELAHSSKKLFTFICELPERYREVVFLYDKAYTYGTFGYYPILQIQASLRIANFLSFAYLSSFSGTFINSAGIPWYNEAKSLTSELSLRLVNTSTVSTPAAMNASSVTNTLIPQHSSAQMEKAILQNGTGVTKLDILTWITRISLTGNEYLTARDYLLVLTGICALCSRIKAHRKHAFFLRLVGTVTRRVDLQQSQTASYSSRRSLKQWSLSAMHLVCELLESSDCSAMNDDDIWLETYGHLISPNTTAASASASLRYGWPSLRIGVLKEATFLSDSDKDHVNSILFCAKLLRKLYSYLRRAEQQQFSDLLLRVVFQHRKQLASEPLKTSLIKFPKGMTLGVPILLRMDVVAPTSRYVVTQHQPVASQTQNVKDTFLYSPFAKKKTAVAEHLFSAHDMIHVDIVLANPFLFEIDVQMMSLHGDGGFSFKPLSISTMIPAETNSHVVRLSCVPLQTGMLSIKGITLRMLGGCIEETLYPLQRYQKDPKRFNSKGQIKRQTDQERFGKRTVDFISTPKTAPKLDAHKAWTLDINVIPQQPMLELLETSLGSHQAITLFEGEKYARAC
ncbi:hypothetical protein HDU91_002647 [Kappamyces sp. JEL0680]|nr:hypothetical protein HDU91_002647 [Kappamyces sp. JEL0680]